jgi:hypothetical protein
VSDALRIFALQTLTGATREFIKSISFFIVTTLQAVHAQPTPQRITEDVDMAIKNYFIMPGVIA